MLLAWFGNAGVIYATVVMTVLIFVVAEVLPKTAAFNAPDRMALAVARPIDRTVRWFAPILRAVEWLVRLYCAVSACRSARSSRSCRRTKNCVAPST